MKNSAPIDSHPHLGRIHVSCDCGNEILFAARFAGRRAKCNSCGRPFTIPAAEGKAQKTRAKKTYLIAGVVLATLFAVSAVLYLAADDEGARVGAGTGRSVYEMVKERQKLAREKEAPSAPAVAAKASPPRQKVKADDPEETNAPLHYRRIVEVGDDAWQLGHSIALNGNSLLAGIRNGALLYQRESSVEALTQDAWHNVATLLPTRSYPETYWGISGIIRSRRDWYVPRCVVLGDAIALISDVNSAPPRKKYPVMKFGFSGAVYVFELQGTTWKQVATLEPAEPANHMYFGSTIAITTNHILVGAPGSDGGRGAVFVFDRVGYAYSTKLSPETDSGTAQFGTALAAYEDRALIGAPDDRASGDDGSGAVYLVSYEGTQWNSSIILPSEDSVPGRFGASVALHGRWALIGDPGAYKAPGRPYSNSDGSATLYALDADGATVVAEVRTSLGSKQASMEFGKCVAIGANIAVIVENYGGASNIWHTYELQDSTLTHLETTVLEANLKNGSIAIDGELVLYGFPNMFYESTTYRSRKHPASIVAGRRREP